MRGGDSQDAVTAHPAVPRALCRLPVLSTRGVPMSCQSVEDVLRQPLRSNGSDVLRSRERRRRWAQ